MRFIDLFKLSTRMFKARTSRTLLTILGMSIGIAAILFLVSLGYGLQKTLLERITTSDSLLTLDVSQAKTGAAVLDSDTVGKIQQLPGVREVSPAFQLTSQGHLENLSADLVVFGCQPSFLKLGGIKATTGSLITDDNPTGIVISSSVAQVFGKSADEMIGKQMTFTYFLPNASSADQSAAQSSADTSDANSQSNTTRVNSSTTYTIIGVVDGDSNTVYVNSAALSDLNINGYGQLKVEANTTAQMNTVRDNLLQDGLLVSSLSDTVDQANKIFNVVKIILMLFGVIALVVSAIGMFNTMTIALLERTEEIGIMKSIGASDGAVSVMFFMEAAIMGFLGGVSGVLIGWLGGQGFNLLVNFVAVRFGGEKVSLFYSPLWLVLVIIGSSAVVGFFTGLVPARKASKTDPLDALRYK